MALERALRPNRFGSSPVDDNASKDFEHWLRTVEGYIEVLPSSGLNKFQVLINFVEANVYDLISDCNSYEDAIILLKDQYIKPTNVIFSRQLLAERKQASNESVKAFYTDLKKLSRKCDFSAVTASKHCDESIRTTFIAGLHSSHIRQRLLESEDTSLDSIYKLALSLELAQKNADHYTMFPNNNGVVTTSDGGSSSLSHIINSVTQHTRLPDDHSSPTNVSNMADVSNSDRGINKEQFCSAAYNGGQKANYRKNDCQYCGRKWHPRNRCPARNDTCYKCEKKGHWSSACKFTSPTMSCNTSAMFCNSTASNTSNNGTFSLSSSMVNAQIGNDSYAALCDTGSSHSYIHPEVVKNMNVKLFKTKGGSVTMASSDFVSSVSFYCFINMEINGKMYYNNKFYVMENICVRVILGLDFLKRHSRVVLEFGGKDDSFHIKSCCLSTLKMQPPSLFANLTEDCKPIATKSRRYSATDKAFISKTVAELMQNKKVEPSNSPWRAQVLCVGGDGTHRRRMAVDYSMTINKFTLPDAYPLAR